MDRPRILSAGSRSSAVAILVLLAAAVALGWAVTQLNITYREEIAFVLLALVVLVFFVGERGLKAGFLLLILTLALGYRTYHLTPNLPIHPSELLLWGLCAIVLLRSATNAAARQRFWFPWWLWAFVPFWILGWITGSTSQVPPDLMLAELRDFVLLIPLFLVAQSLLHSEKDWDVVSVTYFAMSVFVAGMGVLQFIFPGVARILPGFISSDLGPLVTDEGFTRASFSFWGSIDAVFICGIGLPFGWVVWRRWTKEWQRALTLIAVALLLMAIYISGHRNVWVMVAIQLFVFAWLRFHSVLAPILVSGMTGVAVLLSPGAARDRLAGLLGAFTGSYEDYSTYDRVNRTLHALDAVVSNPLGRGWATAGWVHDDYLQVAANLGVLAGLLFVVGVLSTLVRLWIRVRSMAEGRQYDTGLALLLGLGTAAGLMGSDAMIVLPQLVLPTWTVWVFAEVWLRQPTEEAI